MRLRPGTVTLLALVVFCLAGWCWANAEWIAPSAAWLPLAAESSQIDANAATVFEWAGLPGIRMGLARSIVSARTANGGFRDWQDLLAVKGLGRIKCSRLKAHVSFTAGNEQQTKCPAEK